VSASVTKISAEPNLTPLLDVVFQLITFFMLVINFSNDNNDQRVRLPVAGTAAPVDEKEKVDQDRLVLNIDKQGHLLFNGESLPQKQAIAEIKHQADLVRLNLRAAGRKLNPGDPLPTTVVLRGDKETTCGSLMPLITACQANGFLKFSLKAMTET
jgi:biopolymer transport protein ExbD